MASIIYVGMDVHTTNYTMCCYTVEEDVAFARVQVAPDYHEVLKYLERIRNTRGDEYRFVCGYEAGCLGYTLYRQLTDHGVECVILAPSTMPVVPGKRIKTDRRDAELISRCLAYHTYRPVYVPDEEDDAVKEYIRMRDEVKANLKRTKQWINAFCLRHGFRYIGRSNWTVAHLRWLEHLTFQNEIYTEVFQEYLCLYYQLDEKIAVLDHRIEEFSHKERYEDNVAKLVCFTGISTHAAMSLLTEVGDFYRFKAAPQFAAYLGLVPGESSSGAKQVHTGITKAGNSHLRRLLIEAAQRYGMGQIGKKTWALKQKQSGGPPQAIAYADKATERLKRKYRRIAARSKPNVAKTAVARELACFIWGMMTDNYITAA